MPSYHFRDKDTGEEWTEFCTWEERTQILEHMNNYEAIIVGAPAIVSGRPKKPDDGFKDVLKKIKSEHRGADINTF